MNPRAAAAEWEPRYADRAENMRASEIRELLKLLDLPGIVSFAGGIPDPALFPIADARAAYGEVLGEGGAGGAALQYSVSEGYLPLRQWIVRHMGRLGVACEEDNIVITCGSQQRIWNSSAACCSSPQRYGAGDGADLSRRPAGLLRLPAALR